MKVIALFWKQKIFSGFVCKGVSNFLWNKVIAKNVLIWAIQCVCSETFFYAEIQSTSCCIFWTKMESFDLFPILNCISIAYQHHHNPGFTKFQWRMLGKREPRAACSLLSASQGWGSTNPARLSLTGSEDSAAAALHSHASQLQRRPGWWKLLVVLQVSARHSLHSSESLVSTEYLRAGLASQAEGWAIYRI